MKKKIFTGAFYAIGISVVMLQGCGGGSSAGPQVPTPTVGKIVFSSTRDGNEELYLINSDGSGQRRLTNNPDVDTQPDISDDGSKVVWVSRREGKLGLYTMDLTINSSVRLVQRLEYSDGEISYLQPLQHSPSFSHDGREIVFADSAGRAFQSEIFIIGADGGARQQLTDNQWSDDDPAWSPNGSHIAFVSSRKGDSGETIYLMQRDGSEQKPLTSSSGDNLHPSYAPDSTIIFTSTRTSGLSDSAAGEIYRMNSDGSAQTRLTNTSNRSYSPAFDSATQRIIFVANNDIYSLNRLNGSVKRLTTGANVTSTPSAQ